MYRIYGHNRVSGWELIDRTKDEDKAYSTAEALTPKEYYSYMIIRNINGGDEVVAQKSLFQECKVEFVDKLDTKIQVKACTFKPSRAKRKQEDRKMFEDYIDR